MADPGHIIHGQDWDQIVTDHYTRKTNQWVGETRHSQTGFTGLCHDQYGRLGVRYSDSAALGNPFQWSGRVPERPTGWETLGYLNLYHTTLVEIVYGRV